MSTSGVDPAQDNTEAALAEFETLAGQENAAALRSLLNSIAESKREGDRAASTSVPGVGAARTPPLTVHLQPDSDKARRSAVHALLRHEAFYLLRSDTVVPRDGPEPPHIQISYVQKVRMPCPSTA